MSIEVIESQIKKFLSTKTPEVIAIRGAWGVGKTYNWERILREVKEKKEIALRNYSYVSLFGISSLEEFKYAIFANMVADDLIGAEPNIETFKQNISGRWGFLGKQILNVTRSLPFLKEYMPAIESLSFLSLNKILICVDDFERVGDAVEHQEILGLISLLKERKQCKVALLLNDDEVKTSDYIKYGEKVIDIQLRFSPTPRECAELAFIKKGYVYDTLMQLTPKLGINNIRVLKKIERLVELAWPLLEGFEEELKYQVAHSLVLFTWCFYCHRDDLPENKIPSLEVVTSSNYHRYLDLEKTDEDETTQNWKQILRNYDYQITDDLDMVLADAVRSGFFIEEGFKKEALKKNDEIIASKTEGHFSEAWKLFHESFDDNTEEVVRKLYDTFKQSVKYIHPFNLNSTVKLFKSLGSNEQASELIDLYAKAKKDEIEGFDIGQFDVVGETIDPEVEDRFNEIYQNRAPESFLQILDRISGGSGWDSMDEDVLRRVSVDEYYKFFKQTHGPKLASYVDACLKFGRFTNSSERQKEIAGRAKEALIKIGKESEINKKRVLKFGINISEIEEAQNDP